MEKSLVNHQVQEGGNHIAEVPCFLPLGLEPKTSNLPGLFPQMSTNFLLICVLNEWFIDFFPHKVVNSVDLFLNVEIK